MLDLRARSAKNCTLLNDLYNQQEQDDGHDILGEASDGSAVHPAPIYDAISNPNFIRASNPLFRPMSKTRSLHNGR